MEAAAVARVIVYGRFNRSSVSDRNLIYSKGRHTCTVMFGRAVLATRDRKEFSEMML